MILVTGATGFIGRRVIKLLAKKFGTEKILCLVRDYDTDLEISGRKIIKQLHIRHKKIDLKSGNGLTNLPKKPLMVIHMAANTNTGDPDHSVNDVGTKNLFKSLQDVSTNTHIIFTGTTAIFSGRVKCNRPFTEKTKPHPTNIYARSKLNAEKFLIDFVKEKKCKLTIVRLPTVWGQGMRNDSFFNFLKKHIYNRSLITRLNWPGKSGFIHVDDVAKIITTLANKTPRKQVNIYTLQTEALTLEEIFRMVYHYFSISYEPIALPQTFWRLLKFCRFSIVLGEKILPSKYYNYLWRLSIIVDDVIYADTRKIRKEIKAWKVKRVKENLVEVL